MRPHGRKARLPPVGLHLELTGGVHFNVDKGLLVGGAAQVHFGGGRRLRPFQIIIAGRADLLDGTLTVEDLASWLHRDLGAVLPDAEPGSFELELRLNPPAPELARLVAAAGNGTPRANDTSVAVVSLPRSPLEEASLVWNGTSALPRCGGAFRSART